MRWLLGGIFLGLFLPLFQGQPNHAYLKAFVDKSLAHGMVYLKKAQSPNGNWSNLEIGATALAGLALLEAGCSPDDPVIIKGRNAVLEQMFQNSQIYSFSLSLLFLDRLGNQADIPIIESLAVRILEGQTSSGGWGYNCPGFTNLEKIRLQAQVAATVELKGVRAIPKVGLPRKNFSDLSPDLQKQIRQIQAIQSAPNINDGLGNDNSNTQFATLALWVARRYGIPIDLPMQKIRNRFIQSQNPDGGWGYNPGQSSTPTMTAAGCLCLALSTGFLFEKSKEFNLRGNFDPAKDAFLIRGLQALSSCIGNPFGPGRQAYYPNLGNQAGQSYYFLWSMERVARGLGVNTLAKKDWYAWGAEIILASQSPEGSWNGDYKDYFADTSFAILFLTKANFVQDLTTLLRGSVNDPGGVELHSGGVGGKALLDLSKKGLGLAIGEKGEGASQGKMVYNKGKNKAQDKTDKTKQKTTPLPETSLAQELKSTDWNVFLKALEQIKTGEGPRFSLIIANTIPDLVEERKTLARRAFAERFAALTPSSISEYLISPHSEARGAAINALALRNIETYLEPIVECLDDSSPWVRSCAGIALKHLVGVDSPPGSGTSGEIGKLKTEWKTFLKNRPSKSK